MTICWENERTADGQGPPPWLKVEAVDFLFLFLLLLFLLL